MSPEDFQQDTSRLLMQLLTPAKVLRFALAVQLANKTKERGTVMGRIVCRDLETKLMKQSELLDEAVERKATLQNETKELEVRITEEESRVPPVPPPGPPPQVPVAVHPPPAEENEEDEEMENEAPINGAGVGDFVSPSDEEGDQVYVSQTSLYKIDGVSVRRCSPSFQSSVRTSC